jgi:predicted membrane-bound dolichyl-phosphate-mannose-protein mannosyltransferase
VNFSGVDGRGEVGKVNISVFLIPIVLFICVAMMVVAIVGIVHWSKARDKELQYHQDLRIREMEHQLKMKGLEVELEKAKQKSL